MIKCMYFRRKYTLDFKNNNKKQSQKYSEYPNKICWLKYLCVPQIPTTMSISSGDQKQMGLSTLLSILNRRNMRILILLNFELSKWHVQETMRTLRV